MRFSTKILFISGLIGIFAISLFVFTQKQQETLVSQKRQISGTVIQASPAVPFFLLQLSSGKRIGILPISNTRVIDQNNHRGNLSDIKKTFLLRIDGLYKNDDLFIPSAIFIKKAPHIVVDTPQPYEIVDRTFYVAGIANVAMRTLYVRLKTSEIVIDEVPVMTFGNTEGTYGPFSMELTFPDETRKNATLELFQRDQNGNEQEQIILPLRFR